MHLIEVGFKGNRKEFFLWEGDEPPPLRAAVIVDADRGEDLGRVHSLGELAQKRYDGVAHGRALLGEAPVKLARRIATPGDVLRAEEAREQDEVARRRAMERVKANNLVMKLTDAEWQWDRKKLTIYFTAEKRVDFRNLVRELASMFRTRIELKQIGVRDEAKRLDGVGRCGRQYCSAAWLPELRPVNLGVAKDQRLSLNPSQISGACGRLMCCLRYEHEFYVQSRKRFPKEGKILATARGEEKVVANDIFNERVTLRSPEGETRVVALAELRAEMSGGAPEPVPALGDESIGVTAEYPIDEELIRMQDTAERPAFRPDMPTRSRSDAGDVVRLERRGGPLPRPDSPPLPERRPRRPGDAAPIAPAPSAPARARDTDGGDQPLTVATTGSASSAPPRAEEDEVEDAEPSAEQPGARAGRRRRGRRGGRRGRGRRPTDPTQEPGESGHDPDSGESTETSE